VDPFTLALISGGIGLFGNMLGQRSAGKRQKRMENLVTSRMGQGPGQAEQQLLEWITGGGKGFDPSHLFTGEGYNVGQDALMQMTRAQPFDTTSLFAALEPLESRALEQSLADSFSQASGLGQRFGSSMQREEGRVRGEAAEGAAARRAGLEQQTYESAQQRALQAAGQLGQLGQGESAMMLQALMGLGGMGQQRQGMDMQLLQMLMGMGQPQGGMGGMFGAAGQGGMDLASMMMMQKLLFPKAPATT
jgi:hypothetical protein